MNKVFYDLSSVINRLRYDLLYFIIRALLL